MTFTIEAVYENGILKPAKPLPLTEHEKVTVTVHTGKTLPEQRAGIIPCTDPQVIEWAAMDPELDFPPPPEDR
jgi:predicted DNA-binding antitoxin AbrB/MazE fold protein